MEQTITIFNCENNKYFISNTPTPRPTHIPTHRPTPIPIPTPIPTPPLNYFTKKPKHYEISTFVNVCCNPRIKQYDFVQINKIISIKKIKSISIDSKYMRQFQSTKDYINSYIDKLVFKYMNKYGIDNVRGGSYTDLILSPVQYQFISNKLKKLYKSHNMAKQDIVTDTCTKTDTGTKTDTKTDTKINVDCEWENDDIDTNTDDKSVDKTVDKVDINSILNDLNKMTFYVEILRLCSDIDPDHFTIDDLNNIIKKNTGPNMSISSIVNYPIIRKIESYSYYLLNFSTRSNYFEIRERYRELNTGRPLNLITQYLNLKAELINIKSELAKLNLKYDSVENLQKIIDEELNNPDRLD